MWQLRINLEYTNILWFLHSSHNVNWIKGKNVHLRHDNIARIIQEKNWLVCSNLPAIFARPYINYYLFQSLQNILMGENFLA